MKFFLPKTGIVFYLSLILCYNSYMTWASKRKLQYLGGLFGVIIIIIFIFLYPIIFKESTCNDGKKNGTEEGIDCGGGCMLVCSNRASDPVILWSRAFRVVSNSYNLVAFIQNQNKSSGVSNISYEFRIYDINNRLIGRRQGSTFIPPNKQFAVFESRFDPGQAQIKSVSFEFTEPFVWVKKESTIDNLPIFVDNIVLSDDIKNPSLSARIKNESVYDLPSFDVISILYDENHNAINASKTIKNGIKSNNSLSVFFTWPEPFTGKPVLEDILISINPFTEFDDIINKQNK